MEQSVLEKLSDASEVAKDFCKTPCVDSRKAPVRSNRPEKVTEHERQGESEHEEESKIRGQPPF